MDEPGRLSHVRVGECPSRVQPDGARLQSAPCAEYSRRRGHGEGGRGLKVAETALNRPITALSAPLRCIRRQTAPKTMKISHRSPLATEPFSCRAFSHDLFDFCTEGKVLLPRL